MDGRGPYFLSGPPTALTVAENERDVGYELRTEEHFAADLPNVRKARSFVATELSACPIDSDLVALLVTELATNAVRHATSGFAVRVHITPGRVRIEVEDDSPALPVLPVLSPPGSAPPAGRGVQLLDVMATAWGITMRPVGKSVWFIHQP